MTRDRILPFVALGTGVLCIALTGFLGDLLPSIVRVVLMGTALLVVPGFLVLLACRLTGDVGWLERPSLCFAFSLGMLAIATLPIPLFGLSLDASLPILFALCSLTALVAVRRDATPALLYRDGGPIQEILPLSLLVIATVGLTVGAWLYTETGSIDRWWYLAYVRDFMNAPAIGVTEPFLGSENFLARFSWNTWLLSFAAWAHFSTADPTRLYEHTSVVFLAPIAVSAAVFLGRATFDTWRLALITGLCSILIWTTGSLLPAMTRLPEDKLLAILVLAPVLIGTIVRATVGGRHGWGALHRRNWLPAVAFAALATATVHPFVYGIAMIVALPFLVLYTLNRQTNVTVAAALIAVLLVFGGLSYAIGSAARDSVAATGASIENLAHPVVRVHMSQNRLVDIGFGTIVSPKLLVHPLIILGFLALLPLVRRSYKERYLITPATFVALSIAFLAPLTWLAGQLVLPWMVYRILWAIPFALLLTVVIDEIGRLTRVRVSFVFVALALLSFPWLRDAIEAHRRPERQALAAPNDGEMVALAQAITSLPANTIIVAAPRLSERIPALTGKHVLALSDRGTVVFAGNLETAEKRLQARTAALIGLWRPIDGVPDPTHIIFAPGSPAERYCGATLFAGHAYRLCTFVPADPVPGVRLYEAKSDGKNTPGARQNDEFTFLSAGVPADPQRDTGEISVSCTPDPEVVARTVQWKEDDPWTALVPGTRCTFTAQDPAAMPLFVPRGLSVTPFVGNATEEVVVSATAWRGGNQNWNLRTRNKVVNNERLEFSFPQTRIDKLEVTVTPAYLPFLKLRDLVVTFEDAARVEGKDARVNLSTEDDIAPKMNLAEHPAGEQTPNTTKPVSIPVAPGKSGDPGSSENERQPDADGASASQKAPESGGVIKISGDVRPDALTAPRSRAEADLGTPN